MAKKHKLTKAKKAKATVEEEYGTAGKKWIPTTEFTYTMSVPQYCTNFKKFEGRDGQHMMSKCK